METSTAAIERDYRLLTESAGLVERRERGQVDVTGPDAAEFLQGQVTNDVLALEPGAGCYAALLNPKGRILADMRVLARAPEELWLDTAPGALEAVLADLRMYKIGRRVEIADRSTERSILSVIGPAAPEMASAAIAAVGTAVPALPAAEHSFAELSGPAAGAILVATDLGLDLVGSSDAVDVLRGALVEAGAAPVDAAAAEVLRIETGRPLLGADMTDENLPGEAGIVDRAVSFTKGCYVGQEPVARMYHRGHPNRHLRGLLLTEPAAPGDVVMAADRDVGRVTSAGVSPALGAIALAIVRREVEPGAAVVVGAGEHAATVAEVPLKRP